MSPLDPTVRQLVDELANALQSVVLIAEQLERETRAVDVDSREVTSRLRRVTSAVAALRQIQREDTQ